MTNRGLLIAAAVLLAGNAVILGGVMRNRAGNPDAVVRLSERELQSWGSTTEGAEEILNLRIQWNTAPGAGGADTWFDRARLEALGVADLPAVGDTAPPERRWTGTRPAYVVLELAGPAWERWDSLERARRDSVTAGPAAVAQDAHAAHGSAAGGPGVASSRLMAVDIGLDPMALRQQYPDRSRYLILPATYQVDRHGAVQDSLGARRYIGETVAGRISQLLPGTVHVPRPLRDSLLALGAAARDSTTRFEVTLKVGKSWEAWVE